MSTEREFETAAEPEPIEIEVRGKKGRFLLRDISAQKSDEIFLPILSGTDAEKKVAQRAFRNKLISAVVLRGDGSQISVEDAAAMRIPVAAKLQAAALKFLNPDEDETKNASSANESGTS